MALLSCPGLAFDVHHVVRGGLGGTQLVGHSPGNLAAMRLEHTMP